MPGDDFLITASTKVAALLDRYPELEDVLIGIAPPFEKLRNPILRKSVARVVSLRQAAAVGRVAVDELVNTLRKAVGQEAISGGGDGVDESLAYFGDEPGWFERAKIVASIDERRGDNPDEMPLAELLRKAVPMQPGEIVELITAHLPAPGIDIMKQKGYRVWSLKETPELIRTFFSKV